MAKATGGAHGKTAEEVFANRVRDLTPIGHVQTPEEIAAAALFLCSDPARSITGQIIGVDGGITV